VRRRFTPQAWALRCRITQQPSQRPVGDALGQRSARSTVLLAWAGIIGPIPSTAAFLAQEAFLVDDYSPLAETVSALEAQPHGWVQQINFVVFGLLTIAFAVGLHRGVRPTRAKRGRTGSIRRRAPPTARQPADAQPAGDGSSSRRTRARVRTARHDRTRRSDGGVEPSACNTAAPTSSS
jgi:hypothetical protein